MLVQCCISNQQRNAITIIFMRCYMFKYTATLSHFIELSNKSINRMTIIRLVRINQCLYNCQIHSAKLIIHKYQMAKKLKPKINHVPDIRSFPIAKTKSFAHNLTIFLRMLEQRHLHLTSRQFIMEIHAFVARYRQKTKSKELAVAVARQKIRICRECDGWSGNKPMLQCTLCQDYYHQDCLHDEGVALKETGLCMNCEQNKIGQFDKDAYLSGLLEDNCSKCGKEREEREAFVNCLRCSNRFHKKCYGKSGAVCGDCKLDIDQQIKSKATLRQSTLLEYGCSSSKKQKECLSPKTYISLSQEELDQRTKKIVDFKQQFGRGYRDEQSTRHTLIRDLFCLNYPQISEQELLAYKQGLHFAILAKNMTYTETLQPLECSLDINTEESLDFGLDHMSKIQYDTYKNYKKQPIGPFKYVFKTGMGYDVVADRDIKEKTLICQYIGDVVTLRRCIQLQNISHNDSLMELRAGCNSDETLIIRPQKHTNMARFINGINNTKGGNKANVATVRKLAKGMPTVILYAIRNIRKGESLLYDYNAGGTTAKYDTSQFL